MKLPEYTEGNLDEQTLHCPNCGWTGKGFNAVKVDFFGVVKDQEVHCPNCDTKLAILIRENNQPGKTAAD